MTIDNISKSGQNRFSSAIAWQHGGPGGILEYDILYYGIGGEGVVYPSAVPPVYVVWGVLGCTGGWGGGQ